jgi:hypothetical protein
MRPTSPSEQPACSCCGKRPATHFIYDGSASKTAAICEECVTTQDTLATSLMAEAKSAKCVYCGGSPCSGGIDTIAQLTGGTTYYRWLCLSCSPEYYAFMQAAFGGISEGLPHTAQLEEMCKIGVAIDQHMRSFVRSRDN